VSAGPSRSERKARELLKSELMPNEIVLWSGRPKSSGVIEYFAKSWTRIWIWSAVVLAWPVWSLAQETGVASLSSALSRAAARLAVVLAVLLVLGLAVAAALTLLGGLAFRTLYAVTDQRLLVVRQGWAGASRWMGRSELKRITVKRQLGQRATLVFERDLSEPERLMLGDPNEDNPKVRWRIERRRQLAFLDLPDAEAIRALVERAFNLQREP